MNPSRRIPILIGSLALVACLGDTALAESPIVGDWKGSLPMGGETQVILLRISESSDGFVTELCNPDNPDECRPMPGKTTFADGELNIRFEEPFPGRLSGDLQGAGRVIDAKLYAGGQATPIQLRRMMPKAAPSTGAQAAGPTLSAADRKLLLGTWEGQLLNFRLVFRFLEEDGAFVGYLDSPDRGKTDILMDEIGVTDGTVRIGVKMMGGTYEAEVDGGTMVGHWSQSGQQFELTLTRQD